MCRGAKVAKSTGLFPSMLKVLKEINKRVGWIFDLCRVELFKIGKRDVTFIREMRVCTVVKS